MISISYFLKKTKNKKSTYLQIYESYYDPERKCGAHRSFKPVGYIHELIDKGIDDPISFYSDEIKKLNSEYKKTRERIRSDRFLKSSDFIKKLAINTTLPLTLYFLNNEDINKMLSHRFYSVA